MATRRRIGVSAATTEAARRQLMQPVPCWEKVWVPVEGGNPGSHLKVYKWVKTEKTQQFSDNEAEADEPLAPLPDELEVVDGDEEMDQDEPIIIGTQQTTDSVDPSIMQDDLLAESKPPSPKPKLSISLQPESEVGVDSREDVLDASLKPLDAMEDDEDQKKDEPEGIELDISGLGPDGLQLEGAQDLSQISSQDVLNGGPMMDASNDPFAEPT